MDFRNTNWKKEKLTPLLNYLNTIKEEEYRDFSQKITLGQFEILGVRIPKLRKIAKEISKGKIDDFLDLDDQDIYELKLIRGFVICEIKDINSYKKYFDTFINTIDNWAVCDTFLSSSKIIKKDLEYFWNISINLLKTKEEYLSRIALVIFLNYYINEDYYRKIFEIIKEFKSEYYYANMALAWLLSFLYIHYTEETKEFLLNNKFDEKVTKYTIRKIKDSFRVKEQDKDWLNILYNKST